MSETEGRPFSPSEVPPSPPRGFLSYASQDRDIASRLAKALIGSGIQVWFAEWDIKAGDSVIRQIEQGLDAAQFFFLLFTPSSAASPWVLNEREAAQWNAIAGRCKPIVVLGDGIDVADLPPFLRPRRALRHDDPALIDELVLECFGGSSRPPLGTPPTWTRSLSFPGYSTEASAIAEFLCRSSERGREYDPAIRPADLCKATDIGSAALMDGLIDLEERGIVAIDRALGNPDFDGICLVGAKPALFFDFDRHIFNWNTEDDALALAQTLLAKGPSAGVADIRDSLGWTTRRVNPAVRWLIDNGFAMGSEANDLEFESYCLIATAQTRRFARRGGMA